MMDTQPDWQPDVHPIDRMSQSYGHRPGLASDAKHGGTLAQSIVQGRRYAAQQPPVECRYCKVGTTCPLPFEAVGGERCQAVQHARQDHVVVTRFGSTTIGPCKCSCGVHFKDQDEFEKHAGGDR